MAPWSAFETPDLGRDQTCVKILLRAYSWKCRRVTRDNHSPSCRISAKGPQQTDPSLPLRHQREMWEGCHADFGFAPGWNSRNQHCVLIFINLGPCKSWGSLSSKHAHNWAGDRFLPPPPPPPDYCSVLDSFKKHLLRACFVPGTVLGPWS